MAAPNFNLITEVQTLHRRDFPLSDPTILQPLGANPLLDGEWLEIDTATYSLKRGTGAGSPLVFPVWTERGRYDTQAIGKSTVLMLGQYEAETTIVNVASLVIGSPLSVQDVTVGGLTKRGLALSGGGGQIVVGFVSRLPGNGKVRFVHFGNQAT